MILITRPAPGDADLAARLEAARPGIPMIRSPLLRRQDVPATIDLTGAQGLIFTSRAGVDRFAALSDRRDLRAYCVGPQTAEAARAIGLAAEPLGGTAEALAAALAPRIDPGNGVLVHPRGAHGAAVAGLPVRPVVVYRQALQPLSADAQTALARGQVAVAPLYSPRTAAALQTASADSDLTVAVALSPAVAAKLDPARWAGIQIAPAPEGDAMLRAILAAWDATALSRRGL